MEIVVGSDHNGSSLEEILREHLVETGYEADDISVENTGRVEKSIFLDCQ